MDTADFTAVVAAESARLLTALRRADLATVVPTTPEWTVADLAWHVAEVQWFWGAIVADLVDDPEPLVEPERPDDDAVLRFLAGRSTELVAALERRDPGDACWSWSAQGGTVGWVARRQAHEAIIHRVDAELVAGRPVTPVAADLAADGVDEMLTVMIDVPPWATFESDGTTIAVRASDTDSSWTLALGRFTGTSPGSGRSYDRDTARLDAPSVDVDATVTGAAWDLDRWLWGRGGPDALHLSGDRGLIHRLRAVAEVE